jgi:hypothetical protein
MYVLVIIITTAILVAAMFVNNASAADEIRFLDETYEYTEHDDLP